MRIARLSHIIAVFALAPLIAPIVIVLMSVVFESADAPPFEGIPVFFVAIALNAYSATLVLGLPMYLIAARWRRVTPAVGLLAGGLSGLVCAVLFHFTWRGISPGMALAYFVFPGGLVGSVAGYSLRSPMTPRDIGGGLPK